MNHARRDLCGGCPVMGIPTAIGRDLLYLWESKRPKSSSGDSLVGVPDVIASQIEMLPAERRGEIRNGAVYYLKCLEAVRKVI